MDAPIEIVVSGHLCLDLLPHMSHIAPEALSTAGKLFEIGALDISTGGAVSNTGLAIHRLGGHVALMSGVGDDLVGRMILGFLDNRDPALSRFVRVREGQPSSYTIVLSPQRIDRVFLHCTGTNDTFTGAEIDFSILAQTQVFHLGYPPLLPRLYLDSGIELSRIYSAARQAGAVTSLDMSLPDAGAASGQADWRLILERTLPYVDVFVPSMDETRFMIGARGRIGQSADRAEIADLIGGLRGLGDLAVVGLKLGEQGVYLVSGSAGAIDRMQRRGVGMMISPDQTAYHPAYQVEIAGTTGAGDSAYGALLVSLVRGHDLMTSAQWMCAVGACNVEAQDATSGIRTYADTATRIASGWPTLPGLTA